MEKYNPMEVVCQVIFLYGDISSHLANFGHTPTLELVEKVAEEMSKYLCDFLIEKGNEFIADYIPTYYKVVTD